MVTLYSGLNGLFTKKKPAPKKEVARPVVAPVVKTVAKPFFAQPVVTRPFATPVQAPRPVITPVVKTVAKPIFAQPAVTRPVSAPAPKKKTLLGKIVKTVAPVSMLIKPIVKTVAKPVLTRPATVNKPVSAPVLTRPATINRPVIAPVLTRPATVNRPVSAPVLTRPATVTQPVIKPIFAQPTVNKPVIAPVLTRPATVKKPIGKPARKPILSVSNLKPATIAAVNKLPEVTVKKAEVLQEAGIMPNVAQLETMAAAKGTTVKEEIEKIVENAPVIPEAEYSGSEPAKKSNTMLYVGGGILAVGLAYVAFKK